MNLYPYIMQDVYYSNKYILFPNTKGTLTMAFDPSPTGYYPNINVTGVIGGVTGVFFPYEDLESYDYVVATGDGDIRQLMYSLIEPMADTYLALATADRPGQVTITRSSTVPSTSGVETIRKNYTFTINVLLSDTEVIAE